MRRSLQITIAVFSLAPLIFSLLNWYLGAARYMPVEDIVPAIDSQFRFQSGVYLSAALLLWWMIPKIERMTVPFSIVVFGIFIGALGRFISHQQFGPAPGFVSVGMWFELSMPALIIWQRLVATRSAD
ncbi:MAG: DUF4345 domain-containing protein [Pseudomonadota bacterium]